MKMNQKNVNELTYSEAVSELEEILGLMQSEDCSIDNLSEYTARSKDLIKVCKDKLTKTDEQLKKILEEIDK